MKRFAILGACAAVLAARAACSAAAPARPVATPTPIPIAAPAALPYPAYGTPAPEAAIEHPQAGVPQNVTLAQAIAIAAARSPVLAIARSDYRLTQLSADLARTGLLPNVSGTGSLTRSQGGGRGNFGGSNANQSNGTFGNGTTSVGLSVGLRQLIYDGGRVIAQIHQAQSNQLAGAGTYERALQTLSFNVAQAYYTALLAQAATALAVQVVTQDQVQENLVAAQLRAGTVSRVDLATAQVPTAQARVALVRAQGNELSALATFANSMGLDASTAVHPINDTPANPVATLLPNQILSYDRALQRALALRPDYLASQYAVQAAQYNVRVARLGRAPSLSGTANVGTNSTTANGTNFSGSGSVGLTLTLPIFDQGITRVQTQQAEENLAIAQSELQQTQLGVGLSVRQALAGLVSAESAVSQAQLELADAREVLNATQAQYRAGVTTLPLLLNAQVALTQAETDRLNAVYQLRQAEQTYLYALGENDRTATAAPAP